MEPSRTTGAFTGVVKLDLQAAAAGRPAEAGRIVHGGARLGGECVFVPSPSGPQGAPRGAACGDCAHLQAGGQVMQAVPIASCVWKGCVLITSRKSAETCCTEHSACAWALLLFGKLKS